MQIYVKHWGDDLAKLTIDRDWGDDLAKLIIFGHWGDEIGSHGKFSTAMKYIGGDAAILLGRIHSPLNFMFI